MCKDFKYLIISKLNVIFCKSLHITHNFLFFGVVKNARKGESTNARKGNSLHIILHILTHKKKCVRFLNI